MTNDPEDSRPLAMEGGVVVGDGKGGKKKVMTMEDVTPKYTRDKQLAPLRNLLHKLLDNLRLHHRCHHSIMIRLNVWDLQIYVMQHVDNPCTYYHVVHG